MSIDETSTEQKTSAKINWSKIVGKAANGAKTIFEPVMPATVNTISSSAAITRDVRNAVRNLRSILRRQNSERDNSSASKKAFNLFQTALSAIQSGEFAIDKIGDDLYDDYESYTEDSFTMPTGDEAADMSSEEILLLGNKGVAESVIQSSSAQLRGMKEASKSLINANIKSTQALGLSINNTLHYGFSNINTTLTITNQKLDSIHSTIQGILDFNNTNALEFYSKSIDMMTGMGKMMENLENSMMPPSRKKNRSFDVSQGFDIKEYFEYIKKGIKESFVGTAVSMGKQLLPNKNSDVGGSYGILDMFIPDSIKKPFKKLDRTFVRTLEEGLLRLGDSLNDLFFGAGDIFGNRREKIKSITLNSYIKDATPWNGMAQKALVEVIPELLTSIDSKIDNSEKRYYDYSIGQFKKKSQVEKDFLDDYSDTFAINLRESFDELTKTLQSTGKSKTEQERLLTEIQGIIDDRLAGSKDIMRSRKEIYSKLIDFNVKAPEATSFIREFEDGMKDAISKINDIYHEIGSTQHIYRNILNTHREEYTSTFKNMHKNRKSNFRTFSFASAMSPNEYVKNLQTKAGINDIDLTDDNDFVRSIMQMAYDEVDESELIDTIKSEAARRGLLDDNGKFRFIKRIKNKMSHFTNKTSHKIGKVTSFLENVISNPIYIPKDRHAQTDIPEEISVEDLQAQLDNMIQAIVTPNITVSTTSEFIDKARAAKQRKRGSITLNPPKLRDKAASSVENKAVAMVNALALKDPEQINEQTASANERDQKVVDKGVSTMLEAKEPETAAEAEAQNTNSLKVFLGGILASFKRFTSSLFGKEGLFRRLWNSDARKKATEKLKTKLFTGEDAIFKKQYDSVRAGLKKLRERVGDRFGERYDFLYDNTMQYMYGEDYQNKEAYKNNTFLSETLKRKKKDSETISEATAKATEVVTSSVTTLAENTKEAAENLDGSLNAFGEAVAGDLKKSPEEKKKLFTGEFVKRLKATLPKTLVATVGGATIGALNNQFSLLGSMFLPGGPVAGAIVGGGLSILSQTEAFQQFMFGKYDENSKMRIGGLISQEMRNKFKKLAPIAIGGGVIGALSGLTKGALGFDSNIGVLGMQLLPGGILGGAILGAGIGILKNSDKIKTTLFGKKDEDGKRSGAFLSESFNKTKEVFHALMPGLKKAGLGVGIGALTGAVLKNAGYLPAMLSLGGPIGMGIAGLGLGIASSTTKFDEWMFGTKDADTGKRRKDGVLTRVTNLLRVNVIEPIGDSFKKNMLNLVDWTKEKITFPFRLAIGPILDSLMGVKDNIVEFAKEKFEEIGGGISKMISGVLKDLFSPITNLIGFIGKSIMNVVGTGAKIALSPLALGAQTLQVLTAGKRRKEYVEYYKQYYTGGVKKALNDKWAQDDAEGKSRGLFGRFSDTIAAYLGQGEAADMAKAEYNKQMTNAGKNHQLWRNIGSEKKDLKANKKQRRKDEKKWAEIDKARRQLVKEFGGRELNLTDSAVKEYRKKFSGLGIPEEYLQTSDDIMELLINRDSFKNRMNGGTKTLENPILGETEAEKEKRTRDETFRNNLLGGVNDVLSAVNKVAAVLGVPVPESIGNTETIPEKMDKAQETANDQFDATAAGVEGNTGGDVTGKDIKKMNGKKLGKRIASKFGDMAKYFGFLKKKKRDDLEAAEDVGSQAGNDKVEFTDSEDPTKPTNGEPKKKESIFSKIWNSFKGGVSAIGSTKIGGAIFKGLKSLKHLGILGLIGFSIAELIKPGTVEKAGASIDEFNAYVNADDFGYKKIFTDFSNWFNKTFIGEWWQNTITPWWNNIAQPKVVAAVDKIPEIVFTHLPNAFITAGKYIGEFAGDIISAVTKTITTLAGPLTTAIIKSTPEILGAVISGSWEIIKSIGTSVWDFLNPKKGQTKRDVSAGQILAANASGKFAMSKDVGSVTANSIEEATAMAKDEYGLSNPVIVQDPVSGEYLITEQLITGKNVAVNSKTGELQNLGGVTDSGFLNSAARLGKFAAGDLLMNAYIGRGIKAARAGTKIISGGLNILGKATKGAGKIISKTVGRIPIAGLPAKLIGGGMQAIGTAESALAHPISSIKTGITKGKSLIEFAKHPLESMKNVGKNFLGLFKKGKVTETALDIVEDGAETIIENTAEAASEKVSEKAIAASQGSLLTTLLKKMSKWLDKIIDNKTIRAAVNKLGSNATDNIMTKISKFLVSKIDDIILNASKFTKKLVDLATAAVAKVSGKVTIGTITLGVGELISIGVGAIFGAIDAPNLFEVKDPDANMKWVSAVMEALLSSTVGGVIDFILEAITLISGGKLNFKRELAEFLYKLFCGFSNESVKTLEIGRLALRAEKDVYNAINGTNLDIQSYNDAANKTVFGKVWAFVTGKKTDTKKSANVRVALNNRGYSDDEITKMASEDPAKFRTLVESLGYGPVSSAKVKGMYAQGDPRWAKMPLGMLPDGSIATMDRAGCGPTALAAVANRVSGYGPVSPAMMGAYAATNGYISQGGANSGLFTEGAARLGLNSSPINNSRELVNNLRMGKPTILTGKSGSPTDPYTAAGHIVMADGIAGNNMRVLDPITGRHKLYNINSVAKNTENAWSYSKGYGNGVHSHSTSTLKFGSPDVVANPLPSKVFSPVPDMGAFVGALHPELRSAMANPDMLSDAIRMAQGLPPEKNYLNSAKVGIVAEILRKNPALMSVVTSKSSSTTKPSSTSSTSMDSTPTTPEKERIDTLKELFEYGKSKGFLGTIKLIGQILKAQKLAFEEDMSFWDALADIIDSENTEGSATINNLDVTSFSDKLSAMIHNPQNIREELLGKTIENVYRNESNGKYNSVIIDGNGLPSIGPYQANGSNAAYLLDRLSKGEGISYNTRQIFKKYADKIQRKETITEEDIENIRIALSDAKSADAIKRCIDAVSIEFQNDRFYGWKFADLHDNGLIKDYRSLPLLADMGNVEPDAITNITGRRSDSFIENWKPVNKLAELLAVRNVLSGNKVYFGKDFSWGNYRSRIANTYDNLKNYRFKRSVSSGKSLRSYFNPNTLGYGPEDNTYQVFSSKMNELSNHLIGMLASKGLSSDILGLSTNNPDANDASPGITVDSLLESSESPTSSINMDNASIGNMDSKILSISGTDRDRFLAAAASQLGYYEKSSSSQLYNKAANRGDKHYTKYAQEIGGWNGSLYGPAHWCNFFTSWAGKAAGIPDGVIVRDGSCTSTMKKYISKGLYKSIDSGYTGQPGDLIFFNWGGDKTSADHIGIVKTSDGKMITTYEGNTGNGTGFDVVAEKQRSIDSGKIIGFATPRWTNKFETVQPPNLLSLGYGNLNKSYSRIDSPAYREQLREALNDQKEFKVSPEDFEAIGFGPGMAVDAGFDMRNTDGKLDRIFSLMAEWFESVKTASAGNSSSSTTNINVVKSDTANVSQATSQRSPQVKTYQESLVNNHLLLSSKKKIQQSM